MSMLKNKENREPTKNLHNENMKKEIIEKHKCEIEKLVKEGAWKDQCLSTYFQEEEDCRKFVNKSKKTIEVLERKMLQQTGELSFQRGILQSRVERESMREHELSLEFQKYDAVKNTIEAYQIKQIELEHKKQTLETELNEKNAKLGTQQDNCNAEIQRIRDRTDQEIEACKKEITEQQTIYKRLAIRSSSLETALAQKMQECQELSRFYEDLS